MLHYIANIEPFKAIQFDNLETSFLSESLYTDMVNIGIPKNYTLSPSSFTGTPSLTINREAALELDSSNAFEGKPLDVHVLILSNSFQVQKSS